MNPIGTLLLAWLALPCSAQEGTPPVGPAEGRAAAQAAQAAGTAGTAGTQSFSTEQLEQLVAPIALYPDALLAQLLMASTYPLEIVEAARWRAKNAKLAGDALEQALQAFTWDPSVKSLCGFPDVLQRMNENLDWTQDLGDAFLVQREAIMSAVQVMRRKALEAGTLKSSKEQTVTEEPPQVIVIEAADPEVIYVPTYYPTAAYGTWSYPSYYYPPMYPPPPAGGAWFGFSVGVVWGAAIWGDCDWGHSDIDIDIDHHNTFVDRTESGDRRQQVKDRSTANRAGTTDRGSWQHDPAHRKGVGYRDGKVAQQYGASDGQRRVTRDQARGYGDRSASARPSDRASAGRGTSGGSRAGAGTSAAQRPTGDASSLRASSERSAQRSTGTRSSSLSGSRGASFDRAGSARGASSRGVSGSRGGGGRSGGGRGGGGRGGGGRGRR